MPRCGCASIRVRASVQARRRAAASTAGRKSAVACNNAFAGHPRTGAAKCVPDVLNRGSKHVCCLDPDRVRQWRADEPRALSAPPPPRSRYIMGQQFSGAAAIRAAMMIMGSTYVTYAVGLLVSIIVARSLGPEDFGRYSYVVWVAGILLALGNNGLSTTAIRFMSDLLGRDAP